MKLCFGLAALLLPVLMCQKQAPVNVVDDGRACFALFVSSNDSLVVQAGDLLNREILAMSGTTLPDASAADSLPLLRLVLDGNLEGDSHALSVQPEAITLSSGSGRGLYAGAARLLEGWGCRMLEPDCVTAPQLATLSLQSGKTVTRPAFAYREILMPNVQHEDYALWHGLHNRVSRQQAWGLYVHTFDDLVPPEKWFGSHPEYFTSLNGLRVPDAQLCLSNEDVHRLVVAGLKQRMAQRPEALYWSVSQNDTYSPCTCERCLALDQQYGGPSGTLIWFVNRVAREFPDKVISTLAYQYTRHAPQNIVPEPNVNIMLCTIECDRSRPLTAESGTGAFVNDLKDWAKLTSNIYLWDYVVQFRSYTSPFPNLHVLQPNLQLFRNSRLAMMFQQGSSTSISDMHGLRTYLIAKLLWNPDIDFYTLKKDYLNHYYGTASDEVARYLETIEKALRSSGGRLGIYGTPWDGIDTFLTPELLRRYSEMLDEAARKAVGDSVLSSRVALVRLPVDYAVLENAKKSPEPALQWFMRTGRRFEVNPRLLTLLSQFVDEAQRQSIQRLHERGLSPEDYRQKTLEFIRRGTEAHLALDCPVTLTHAPSDTYPAGGPSGLTDGLRGPEDYHCNWLGFEGVPIEAVVDLGQMQAVSRVAVDFLQDEMAWIFLPEALEVYLSAEGGSWQKAGEIQRQSPEKQKGAFIENYDCRFNTVDARFVRIIVKRPLTCPAWHKGAGGRAWAFCDEIVIQ